MSRQRPRSRYLPKHRLFLAVKIPHRWRRQLRLYSQNLRRRYQFPPGRWLPPASFHLTLLFLGWQTNKVFARLESELPPFCQQQKPFVIASAGLGVFPSPKPAQTLFLGFAQGQSSLARLQQQLCRELAYLHLKPQPFLAHLTLARFKTSLPPDLLAKLSTEVPPRLTMHLRQLVLMESFLHPEGARYRLRRKFPFDGRFAR